MLKSKLAIKQWLNRVGISSYTIHDDYTVDVDGNVYLATSGLNEIPVQFGIVNGNFSVFGNNLKSLKGSPRKVVGNFDCGCNNLKTLDYSPQLVGGHFLCPNNNITSLKGCAKKIGGNFGCYNTKLRSLENGPEIVKGIFKISGTSFDNLDGFQTQVGEYFLHSAASPEFFISIYKELYGLEQLHSDKYQLKLSPEQLRPIQQKEELSKDLPINEDKTTKRIKL